jgi:predicted flap endonuclease-1-like 5' DNA nuclease
MPAFTQDPISRSRGVRSSARAHLARLREDRLQKRMAALPVGAARHGAVAAPDPSPAPMAALADQPRLAVRDTVEDPVGLVAPDADEAHGLAIVADVTPSADADLAHVPEPLGYEAAQHGVGQPSEDASMAAIPAVAPVTKPAHPAPGLQDEAQSPEAPAQSDAGPADPYLTSETVAAHTDPARTKPEPRSDLTELPGAGPGLVWLLEECGVSSMAELAMADADDLTAKLGLVGQLLDLEHWIAHAQSRS